MFSPTLQSLPKTATISTKKNSHKTSHLDIYTKYIALLLFVMSCLLSLQGKPARKCLKMTQKSQHRRRKNCSSWFLSKKSFSQGSKKKTWHGITLHAIFLLDVYYWYHRISQWSILYQKSAQNTYIGQIRHYNFKNFDIDENPELGFQIFCIWSVSNLYCTFFIQIIS